MIPSTNRRSPLSVGIRPAEVCGWVSSPRSSSSCITPRIEAGDRLTLPASAFDPTGSAALEIGLDHQAEDLAHAVGQFADRLRSWRMHLGLAARRRSRDAPAPVSGDLPYAPVRTRPRPDARAAASSPASPAMPKARAWSASATRACCVTASVEDKVPPFLRGKGQGWVTAEYGMLPRATHTRGNREAAKGKQSGRTQEIQRLIGRSLRAVVDLHEARRAPGHRRLRRHPGRRRHPHRGDLRRAGSRCASRSTSCSQRRRSRPTRSAPRSPRSAAGSTTATPVLDLDYDEDQPGRLRRQFRADRRRRDRRGAGHRRGRMLSTRKACCACSASRASAAREIFAAQLKAAGR